MAVAYPVTSTIYGTNWAGTISGTSSTSSGSAVASASVSVKDTTANKWWDGTSFAAVSSTFVPATSGTTSWSLTFGAGHLTSGDSYSVTGQATDGAGNSGTSSPATTFTYNTTAPSVGVSYPVNSTLYGTNWAGAITGTSSSNSGSAVASASVALEDTTAGKWWNGASFTPTLQTFVPVTSGTTSWSLTFAATNLTSGHAYSVTGQATDGAGNIGASSPTTTFTYDTSAPSVAVTYPVASTTYGANWTGTITGTAGSNTSSGLSSVTVAVENTTTTKWWTGTSFSAASQTFVAAAGTTSWSLALAASNLVTSDTYTVTAKATDGVANTASTSAVPFTYSTAAPTLSSINRAGANPTNAGSLGWTVTFSKPVSNVAAVDFALATGSGITGTPTITSVTGTAPTATWTVTASTSGVTGANANNAIGLNMTSAGTIQDQSANALSTANIPFTGQTYTYDTTAPTVTSINTSGTNPAKAGPLSWTVTFSEPVNNVVAGDFGFTDGTGITGTAPTVSGVSGTAPTATWTVTASTTGTTGANTNNTIALKLTSVGTIADPTGNGLSATAPVTGQAFTYDTTGPTAVSIASAPNPQDGKPDSGDQIVYTYSEQMTATSILAGWSGSSTAVTVHFDTGCGSNNCLTVTGVNLGSLDLGTSGYVSNHGSRFDVSGTMVMTTNGSNQSVVTVTLTGSNSNQVTTNTTWVWTPSSSASDLAGNAASATPVTESAAKENF